MRIYKFDDDKFEMVEFKVTNKFKKINCKIKDIELRDGVLITAILRSKNIIFPIIVWLSTLRKKSSF